MADDTADMDSDVNVTRGLRSLRTSKQLKLSAPVWKDTTPDDADGDDLALSITRGLGPLRSSQRSGKFARSSESDYDSPFRLADTDLNPIALDTAQGHNVASVNLANKPLSTRIVEGLLMVKRYSELPQLKLVTTHPSQIPPYRRRKISSTSCEPNNCPLDPSAPLSQTLTTSTPGNGHDSSNLTLLKVVSLSKNISDHKPSEIPKQERTRLLELPLDVLCLVADHLDVVARACLKYAHPALGCWSEEYPRNLSLCARSRIISLLQRDDVSIPQELLGVERKDSHEGECTEYRFATKYCVICRCHGHLSHCPGCRIRTCAREGTYTSEVILPIWH